MDLSAALKISATEIPALAAVEVLVALMECALKIEVSKTDLDRMDFIHLPMVTMDAGPCGFVDVKNIMYSFAELNFPLTYTYFPHTFMKWT